MKLIPIYHWPEVVSGTRSSPEAWAILNTGKEMPAGLRRTPAKMIVIEGPLPSNLNSILDEEEGDCQWMTFMIAYAEKKTGKIYEQKIANSVPALIFLAVKSPDMSNLIGYDNGLSTYTFGGLWDTRLIQAANDLWIWPYGNPSTGTSFLLQSPYRHIPMPKRLSEDSWREAMKKIGDFVRTNVFDTLDSNAIFLKLNHLSDKEVSLEIPLPSDSLDDTRWEPIGISLYSENSEEPWFGGTFVTKRRVKFVCENDPDVYASAELKWRIDPDPSSGRDHIPDTPSLENVNQFVQNLKRDVIDILLKHGVMGPSDFPSPAQYDGFLPEDVPPGTPLGPFAGDEMLLLTAMGYDGPLGVEDPNAWLEAWAEQNQGSP